MSSTGPDFTEQAATAGPSGQQEGPAAGAGSAQPPVFRKGARMSCVVQPRQPVDGEVIAGREQDVCARCAGMQKQVVCGGPRTWLTPNKKLVRVLCQVCQAGKQQCSFTDPAIQRKRGRKHQDPEAGPSKKKARAASNEQTEAAEEQSEGGVSAEDSAEPSVAQMERYYRRGHALMAQGSSWIAKADLVKAKLLAMENKK